MTALALRDFPGLQPGADVGYYDQVRSDLEERIHKRLDFFWEQGIRGSDFFIAAIGPALEVFGQYEEVRRFSGEPFTVSEFLDELRSIVSDYTLVKHTIENKGLANNKTPHF